MHASQAVTATEHSFASVSILPSGVAASGRLDPLRILVVEDDALIGILLGDMLEMLGHEVCAIEATEAGAVRAAAQCAPDVMIVDAQLREGSGIVAVDQILAKGFVPHVFVTGDKRGVSALRPGAVVISKPFTEAMLVDAIVLARKSAGITPKI
jgi:two-component system, response regulator PdtaR